MAFKCLTRNNRQVRWADKLQTADTRQAPEERGQPTRHGVCQMFSKIRPLSVAAIVAALGLITGSQPTVADPGSPEPTAARWQEFGGLVVPLHPAKGLTLRIITDVGVIAPRYQQLPRDNDRWIEHFASGVPEAKESFRGLVAASGWGHIAPYVYAAAYHALGRIYIGMSSNPVLADEAPLLPNDPLRPGEIRIKLYSDCAEYAQTAAPARFASSPSAFYSRANRQVAFCLPPDWFESLRSLQNMEYDQPERAVAHMEEYVNWLVLQASAHELTHAIQHGTRAADYGHDLVSEGAAMFLADNVQTRAESVMLWGTLPAKQPDPASVKACESSIGTLEELGAISARAVDQFRMSADYVRSHPGFSLTRLLDDKEFYRTDIEAHYAIAYSAVWFASTMSRQLVDSWRRVIAQPAEVRDPSDVAAIDKSFARYIDEWPHAWWEHPDAVNRALQAARAQTVCLNRSFAFSAHSAALLLNAYQPDSPLGLVYDGDVFYRWQMFFVALGRYTEASRKLREGDPLGAMVQSRLGDAYEGLGNIEAALTAYRRVSGLSFPPAYAVMDLSGQLKVRYYESTRAQGTWGTRASFNRANAYVRTFKSPQALAEFSAQCDGGRDARCMAKLWEKRYAEVAERMMTEIQLERR